LDSESYFRGEAELIKLYGNAGPQGMRLGTEVTKFDVWEQLAYRRVIIKTKCRGSERIFLEEHPSDPKSCFNASGRQVFDSDGLAHLQILSKTHGHDNCVLNEGPGGVGYMPVESDAANFWLWEKPRVGCRYLLAVDLAEGEDQTKGDDPDAHSAILLRDEFMDETGVIRLPMVAARVRPPNRMPITAFAKLCWLLSHFYGRCMVIPEMNNTGLAFITALAAMKNPPPIWQRTEIDPHSGKERRWTGWRTTDTAEYGGLRSKIIWHLHEVLRQKRLDCRCPHIASELSAFVDKQGRMEAGSGHDDDVITLAIGMANLRSATPFVMNPRDRGLPPDLEGLDGPGDDFGGSMRW
jgi:hypothetical protein